MSGRVADPHTAAVTPPRPPGGKYYVAASKVHSAACLRQLTATSRGTVTRRQQPTGTRRRSVRHPASTRMLRMLRVCPRRSAASHHLHRPPLRSGLQALIDVRRQILLTPRRKSRPGEFALPTLQYNEYSEHPSASESEQSAAVAAVVASDRAGATNLAPPVRFSRLSASAAYPLQPPAR